MINDELGQRMKVYYENISKTKLMRRTPVIIRCDGRSFHTFTKAILMKTMQETTKYLCENIQGCVLGYTQSDEITLILIDYQTLNSSAWFDYEVQKICSISASMATMAFNKFFYNNVNAEYSTMCEYDMMTEEDQRQFDIYWNAVEKGAMFDSRCFNIPREEVANLIYWRQLDASRNSIQMVGHANFSDKEMQNKSNSEIQDMLMLQKNINWNNFTIPEKRGTCIIKKTYFINSITGDEISDNIDDTSENVIKRNRWVIDTNIPIFKNQDRKYIEDLI